MTSLTFNLYRDSAVFDDLRAEWNALLERGVSRVPFLRAEYQRAWWAHRGGGEWDNAELLVTTARLPSGELVGIAPLFYAPKNRDGRAALLFVGSIEISDYLDALVVRDYAEPFFAGLINRLLEPDVPQWEVLDLYNIHASSPTRAALGRVAQAHGWQASESVLEPVPEIRLPTDWEGYLAMMDPKERRELKRKLRRMEGEGDQARWYVVDQSHDVTAEINAFLQMMTLNEDKARFLTPAMRAQFVETVQAAHSAGWLHLAFVEINGEKAAAYLSFDFGNRLWVYNSAIDPRYNALSAGWVLLGYLLQWAVSNRRTAFDFMRGGEDYKYRFGAVAGKIYRLQVSRHLSLAELGGTPAVTQNEQEVDYFPQ